MQHGLNQNVEVRYLGAAIAAASNTNAASAVIDMQGYESVIFYAPMTASVATGVATLTIEQGSAADGSDAVLVAGSTATVTSAATNDLQNRVLESEVFRPTARYVRARRASGTANIAYGDLIAVLVPYRLPAAAGAAAATAYVFN